MQHLQIKKEYPAQRCEICHQADCFDPAANVCTRCQSVQSVYRVGVEGEQHLKQVDYFQREGEAIGFLSGTVFSLVITVLHEVLLITGTFFSPDESYWILIMLRGLFIFCVVSISGQIFGRNEGRRYQLMAGQMSISEFKAYLHLKIIWTTLLLVFGLWLLLGQICG